jgi:hypothetical protein
MSCCILPFFHERALNTFYKNMTTLMDRRNSTKGYNPGLMYFRLEIAVPC